MHRIHVYNERSIAETVQTVPPLPIRIRVEQVKGHIVVEDGNQRLGDGLATAPIGHHAFQSQSPGPPDRDVQAVQNICIVRGHQLGFCAGKRPGVEAGRIGVLFHRRA